MESAAVLRSLRDCCCTRTFVVVFIFVDQNSTNHRHTNTRNNLSPTHFLFLPSCTNYLLTTCRIVKVICNYNNGAVYFRVQRASHSFFFCAARAAVQVLVSFTPRAAEARLLWSLLPLRFIESADDVFPRSLLPQQNARLYEVFTTEFLASKPSRQF